MGMLELEDDDVAIPAQPELEQQATAPAAKRLGRLRKCSTLTENRAVAPKAQNAQKGGLGGYSLRLEDSPSDVSEDDIPDVRQEAAGDSDRDIQDSPGSQDMRSERRAQADGRHDQDDDEDPSAADGGEGGGGDYWDEEDEYLEAIKAGTKKGKKRASQHDDESGEHGGSKDGKGEGEEEERDEEGEEESLMSLDSAGGEGDASREPLEPRAASERERIGGDGIVVAAQPLLGVLAKLQQRKQAVMVRAQAAAPAQQQHPGPEQEPAAPVSVDLTAALTKAVARQVAQVHGSKVQQAARDTGRPETRGASVTAGVLPALSDQQDQEQPGSGGEGGQKADLPGDRQQQAAEAAGSGDGGCGRQGGGGGGDEDAEDLEVVGGEPEGGTTPGRKKQQFAATADDEILVALGSQGGSQPRLDPALLLTETQDIRAALAGHSGGKDLLAGVKMVDHAKTPTHDVKLPKPRGRLGRMESAPQFVLDDLDDQEEEEEGGLQVVEEEEGVAGSESLGSEEGSEEGCASDDERQGSEEEGEEDEEQEEQSPQQEEMEIEPELLAYEEEEEEDGLADPDVPAAGAAAPGAKAAANKNAGQSRKQKRKGISRFVDMEAELSDEEEGGRDEEDEEEGDEDEGELADLIGTAKEGAKDQSRRVALHMEWQAEQDQKAMQDLLKAMKSGFRRPGAGGLGALGDELAGSDADARRRRAQLFGSSQADEVEALMVVDPVLVGTMALDVDTQLGPEEGAGAADDDDEEEDKKEETVLKQHQARKRLRTMQVQHGDGEAVLLDTSQEVTALLKQAHASGTASGKPSAPTTVAAVGNPRPGDPGATLRAGAKFSIFGSDLTNKGAAGKEGRKPVASSFLGRAGSTSSLPPHRSTSNMGGGGKSFVFGTMDHSNHSLHPGESQHGKDSAAAGQPRGSAAAGAKPLPASFTGVRSMVGTGPGSGLQGSNAAASNKATALLSLLQQEQGGGKTQQANWAKALQGLGAPK